MDYFNEITQKIVLTNIRDSIKQNANSVWDKNFDGFIHIVSYPEHRMAVYRITKASF